MFKAAEKTKQDRTPSHIAIIMDGNGRWAKKRGLPRAAGHKRGAETAREIIEAATENNIGYLTLYAFSSENWSRPQEEIDHLMELLCLYIDKELKTFIRNGIKLNIIGDRNKLKSTIQQKIKEAEEKTIAGERLVVTIALSYGSQQEIVSAAKKIAQDAINGTLKPEDINESCFAGYLYTDNLPELDLLIRTGGEQRLSNFLLWQSAYTELYFTETLWPDFSKEDFSESVKEFSRRERRYGNS